MSRSRIAYIPDLDPHWYRAEDFAEEKPPRPIVLVNGTFDLFHAGHAKLLWVAAKKAVGGTLIVAMDGDDLATAKKRQPIQTWLERACMFRYTPVDYLVEINNDEEFLELVKNTRPDLRVRGAEYRGKASRLGCDIPTLWVHDSGSHTSDLITRIRARG